MWFTELKDAIYGFFYHNNNPPPALPVENIEAPPINDIQDKALLNLLNTSLDSDEKYHRLMACIRRYDTDYLNQIILVESHETVDGDAGTPPHWTTTATKRTYNLPNQLTAESQFTTLANIVATNELNFSSRQMCDLFQALMDKGVDFCATDQSPYLDLIHPKSGNNPLKSLIAASLDDALLIELLHEFIDYIAHSLPPEQQTTIIHNQDNFAYDAMKPAEFLLRLGHEDLALRLYEMGAQPSAKEFRLACASYATTAHYDEAMQCIRYIMDSTINLDETSLLEGKESLLKASPVQYNEMLARISQTLREESKLTQGHSTLFGMMQEDYLTHHQDKKSVSFHDFCQDTTNGHHPLIKKYALMRIKQENIGNGFFSDYYRRDCQHLTQNKFTLLSADQKANTQLHNLIDSIENRLTPATTLSMARL
ncbi:hypothetical protein [Legionella spiritensis]|uniref:Uncharacterized protein n=1 Tax=Legionella spiritensis TaxID=452 RepID=A0A0W0YW70_LEGSP|nr:hypothetical protein [Legionella spiritensis]KTD61096.1 hypothetical protein Lspi_2716 [Legionella spiritensis]SNV44869.1 Uncharacterised protein [Legionella spiritensis]